MILVQKPSQENKEERSTKNLVNKSKNLANNAEKCVKTQE